MQENYVEIAKNDLIYLINEDIKLKIKDIRELSIEIEKYRVRLALITMGDYDLEKVIPDLFTQSVTPENIGSYLRGKIDSNNKLIALRKEEIQNLKESITNIEEINQKNS